MQTAVRGAASYGSLNIQLVRRFDLCRRSLAHAHADTQHAHTTAKAVLLVRRDDCWHGAAHNREPCARFVALRGCAVFFSFCLSWRRAHDDASRRHVIYDTRACLYTHSYIHAHACTHNTLARLRNDACARRDVVCRAHTLTQRTRSLARSLARLRDANDGDDDDTIAHKLCVKFKGVEKTRIENTVQYTDAQGNPHKRQDVFLEGRKIFEQVFVVQQVGAVTFFCWRA